MGGYMNNNFYDIPSNWYNEFNKTFNAIDMYGPIMEKQSDNSLANPKLALDRGNLFNNLYVPYKNYKYRELRPNNKQEELLYNLLQYSFAMKEIELFLDTNPFNQNMINLYNNYLSKAKKAQNEYEQNYGPITLDSDYLKGNTWNWLKSKWPWEGTR